MTLEKKRSRELWLFNLIGYGAVLLFSATCVLPFLLTLSGSFTDEKALYHGISLIPQKLSTQSYRLILRQPWDMLRAYGVTVSLVCAGTFTSLFVTAMTAFVLQRKDFKLRSVFAFYFYFTTLFNGGLVPYYILMTHLKLRDNYLVMLVSGLVSAFYIIIVRSYYQSTIPDSIEESAKIDGAGYFRIFAQLYLPLSKPVLATIGLFMALQYWNEWYNAMLFITNRRLYPLQYYLYNIFSSIEFSKQMAQETGRALEEMPQESYKLAMTVFTIGPVVFFYPFVQKYFIKGMTVGAVKG